METLKLQPDRFYHIYNCGINGCDIFKGTADYERFLTLYDKYIVPVAETYAWVLMGNHFHVLVRVKEEGEMKTLREIYHCQGLRPLAGSEMQPLAGSVATTSPVVADPGDGEKWKNRKPIPSHQFAHLFNAYAQYFNTKYYRHGSLFEKPFKRKLIDNERYFRRVVAYINNNPVHHGFCQKAIEYPWSSFMTCVSTKQTKLMRDEVIRWFGDVGNFVAVHNTCADHEEMEAWLMTS